VVPTTEPQNNMSEWHKVAWAGGDFALVYPWVSRDRVRSVEIQAVLNGPPQTVRIHIFDLTSLDCDLRIKLGENRWKDYAGHVQGNVALMTATTNPNQARVWEKLTWSPSVEGRGNVKRYGANSVGDQQITVSLGGKSIVAELHLCQWPQLAIHTITFSGGHTINNDLFPDFGTVWRSASATGVAVDSPPLCYTRNSAMTLTAEFRVAIAPTDIENVRVRGKAIVASGIEISWVSGPIAVAPGAATVSFPAEVAGSQVLPDHVAHYEHLSINWEMSDPDGRWTSIGQSRHRVYVTLAQPLLAPLYLTALHYACVGASGARTEMELVEGVFSPLGNRDLVRQRDGTPLTYWIPSDTKNASLHAMLGGDGSGQCGARANFLIAMYRAHGVNTGRKLELQCAFDPSDPRDLLCGPFPKPSRGFLVATWTFNGTPPSPNQLTHLSHVNCIPGPPAPGQRNANPPASFYNHFIVYCASNGRFYDPSYGTNFATFGEWEVASISGLFVDPIPLPPPHPPGTQRFTAGYSPVGAYRLLNHSEVPVPGAL